MDWVTADTLVTATSMKPFQIEKMECTENWHPETVFLRYVRLSTRYYRKELEGIVPSKRLQELTEPWLKIAKGVQKGQSSILVELRLKDIIPFLSF